MRQGKHICETLKGIRKEIAQDVELMKSGQIKSSKWHFFRSPETGKVGAS